VLVDSSLSGHAGTIQRGRQPAYLLCPLAWVMPNSGLGNKWTRGLVLLCVLASISHVLGVSASCVSGHMTHRAVPLLGTSESPIAVWRVTKTLCRVVFGLQFQAAGLSLRWMSLRTTSCGQMLTRTW
jgi:hypothetical protein